MFFEVWNKTRANKENIIYAVVTIFLLERVRTGWNRIDERGRKRSLDRHETERRQNNMVVKASFLYALPLLLPVVKYIYRSIEELSWSVQGLVVLKNTWVFLGVVAVVECFLAVIIFNLLMIYIDRMNSALSFFTKIGRNLWDGSKMAVQVSGDVGSRVVGGVRSATASAWSGAKSVTGRHSVRAWSSAKLMVRRTVGVLPTPLRSLHVVRRRSKETRQQIGEF